MNVGESYAWLQMLVDTSFASRFLVSGEGKIIYANPAAQALFGYTEKEFENKPIDMIFATEADHNKGMPPLSQPTCFIAGDHEEIKGKTKDGAVLIIRVGTTPFRTLIGTYLAVTCFDVTKYKERSVSSSSGQLSCKLRMNAYKLRMNA